MRIRPLKFRHHYIIPRPGSHDHAGGGPVAPPGGTHPGGGGTAPLTDPDAAAYVAAVEAADGQPLEPAVRTATQNLVTGLKTVGAWDSIEQLILTAGPRTAAGAKIPVRGTVHCEFDETKATHVRAFGFRAKPGSGWYIDSKVAASSLTLNNAAILAYFSEWQYKSVMYPFGSSGLVNGGCCLKVEISETPGNPPVAEGCFQSAPISNTGGVNVGRVPYYYVKTSPASSIVLARYNVTLTTPTTNNNVAGTIRIGSAPPAGPGESIESYIPDYLILHGGNFSVMTVGSIFKAWREELQNAIPPAAKPAVPVFKSGWEPFYYADGGGVYFWLAQDDPNTHEYRVYLNGVRLPANNLNMDGNLNGMLNIVGGQHIGETFELAAWNGAGETRTAPVVIESRNPPS